ncbi:hypothetical protein EON82_08705 [bacterium]|nr:MAG: hypothetical protein EON82_08705 [bacterium]
MQVAKDLLEAKGPVDIRIYVDGVTEARLELLKKAGLKVGSHDGAGLVFGTATAEVIRALAKLDFVQTIAPLRPR